MAHLTLCQWLRGLAAANEAEQGSAVGRCRLTLTTTYDLSASSKPGINHNTTSPKSLPYSKLSAKLSLLHSKRARRHCAITGYGCKSLRYASFCSTRPRTHRLNVYVKHKCNCFHISHALISMKHQLMYFSQQRSATSKLYCQV